MEKMLLFVFFLSEWFILSCCLPRQYHNVDQNLTWTEAQTYCRQTYTDLATATNAEEVTQIINSALYPHKRDRVWFGLYSEVDWRWSDGFNGNGAEYRNWYNPTNQPDFVSAGQLCVNIGDAGEWWDDYCSVTYPFICNNGTRMDPVFVLVNDRKNWSDAQRYCRKNFIDLVTIRNLTENQQVKNLVPSGDWAWTGLSRDPNFYWSDRTRFSFSNWDNSVNQIGSLKVICGVVDLYGSGKWRFRSCHERRPFLCQSIPPANVQVIKLRLNSSTDLNNQNVKPQILKKLQEKLEGNATGVTLKWKEQPDGKVFHKEEKSSLKKNRKKREL